MRKFSCFKKIDVYDRGEHGPVNNIVRVVMANAHLNNAIMSEKALNVPKTRV